VRSGDCDAIELRRNDAVDLSICPSNLGTNTTTVAVIIGEKAAEIIEKELRGVA